MKDLPFERLSEVDGLLDRALDFPAEDRRAFLDEACPDPDIREAVARLLAAEATSRTLFDGADAGSWMGWAQPQADAGPEPGDRVGDYRLAEILGRGGSATVFRAERIHGGFEQEVALKILDMAVLSSSAMERFRLERQILAGLQHPNIARLLGGGVTDDGRPYIVMEFVDGTPIDRYCDTNRLPIRDRLELFRVVCGAVGAANQKLIVHRDLKPGNVMVTTLGHVKLLDFGIAKLLDPGTGAESGTDTRTGVHPMTPAYASPEQALGLPITTATDVYQLGVLLFELLCGRRPRDESVHTLSEIRDWLGGEAVEPPSKALDRSERRTDPSRPGENGSRATAGEIARRRRSSLDRLRLKLRGDLDQITICALRAEASSRYPSVSDLDADIGRFLAGRPVHAQPPSFLYRAGKFLGRHRIGTALTALGTGAILYLGTGLVRQYRETVVERDKASAISSYMIGMFTRADPWQGGRDTLSAVALLEEGAARLDEDLESAPLVRAAMSEAIGRALAGLGQFDRAGPLLESALDIRRARLSSDDPDLARSLDAVGDWMTEARRIQEAEPFFREAADVTRAAYGAESRQAAEALAGLAYVQHLQGRSAEAESNYAEALRVYAMPEMDSDDKTAEAMSNLAWLLMSRGRLDEAEEWMRRGYDLRLDLHGPDHPLTGNSLAGLARITGTQQRWESSLMLAERVLGLRERNFPPDHPWIGDAHSSVAWAQAGVGRVDAAAASYRNAIRVLSATRGPRSPDLALIWNDLALLLRNQARFQEAETPAREAFAIYSATRGERHLFTAIAAHNLASILAPLEELDEAEELYRFSLAAKLESGPRTHPGVAQTQSALGGLLVDLERPAEAEPLLREALEVQMAAFGRNHWQTGLTFIYLGETLEVLAGPGAGEALVEEGYEAVLAGLGPENVETLSAEVRVARLVGGKF